MCGNAYAEYIDVYSISLVLFCCIDIILHYQSGQNSLHIAAFGGHLEMVKYLLPKFGPKKFDVTNSGHTCLTVAIQQQKQDIVDYLLKHGGFGSQQ